MIFAVDFDGTIVENAFPAIGEEKPRAVETMKDLQAAGHKIIIWTCRGEPYIGPIRAWFLYRGFIPDAVNGNAFEFEASDEAFADHKVFANYYFDDRSFPEFSGWEAVREAFL